MGQNAMCPVWVYSLEGIGPSIGNVFSVRFVWEACDMKHVAKRFPAVDKLEALCFLSQGVYLVYISCENKTGDWLL